ncbi:MAG: 4Fe-4S binding protein [Deltaproteobacteria bacterium]|nr:4Fe-4S binding protein [Deltaproteobacteria bacterium]
MGHIINAKEEIYHALAERLSKSPEGSPINETLMAILHRLYTESEAMVGSRFPLVPVPLDKIAAITGMGETELKTLLDGMSHKGLVVDIPRKDSIYYMLTPMLVGFFEYTFMRTGNQLDMKELAELFDRYFHKEEVMREIAGLDTRIMRTLVYENVIPVAVETEVLTYERASEIIRQSGGGAIAICPCRHEAAHLGKACNAPVDVCTSLGGAAEWIVRKGLGKAASVDDLLRVLDQTQALGLVHLCDNVLNKPTYICHCCGCCCKVLSTIDKQNIFAAHPSNFIPSVDPDSCISCGVCTERCPIHAIGMTDAGSGRGVPQVNTDRCIGCGVCSSACPSDALPLSRRPVLHIPPEDLKEKQNRMMIEKGRV